MRPKLINPVQVTLHPQIAAATDNLGDATVMARRGEPIVLLAQADVTRQVSGTEGSVGLHQSNGRILIVLSSALRGHVPKTDDLIEMPDGVKLFVTDAQPAFPEAARLGSAGRFQGYRLVLSDRGPSRQAPVRFRDA